MQAIDEIYIKMLHSRNTSTINRSVAKILTHIFDRWGIVNNETLQTKEIEIREIVYDPMEHIVAIFNELKDLQHFETVAQINYSDTQLIKFAIQIIKTHR